MNRFASLLLALLCVGALSAQQKLKIDTLSCSNVGFNVSLMMPSSHYSFGIDPDGNRSTEGNMASLYKAPYLNFGVEYCYKSHDGWLFSGEAGLIFGSDNLSHRADRMSHIYTHDSVPIIIGTNGTDAVITCYNRGLWLRGGVGKIFTIVKGNPNSGPFVRGSFGLMQQQTVFMQNEVQAPQVEGDYAYLYDHQRRGFSLSQEVGYWHMSNSSNLFNFHVSLEVIQCWSHSTRDFIIDDYMQLAGPDNNRYFDLVYMLKLCWIFPLTGEPSYDYYYY